MKYKGLMLDVDGTIIPYDYQALPSQKVITSLKKAQEKVTVCLVTGRSFISISNILKKLSMHSGFAVVNNGAHVIDIESKKILYESLISPEVTKKIIKFFRDENIPFAIKGSPFEQEYIRLPDQTIPENISTPMFFTNELFSSEKADELIKELSSLTDVSCHKTHHREPNKFGVLLSHINATKQNGIYELEKYLGIDRELMIGVGDGYNDFPLLMACGLKVAMGNAAPDLKEIADYVAPSVHEDGVADVVEKYILR
jgi:Cof subfamily protein (haloacid dehalogenase superfamily)